MAVLVAASRLFNVQYAIVLLGGLSGLALVTVAGSILVDRSA
jgi:hypothetical protein